MAGLLGIAIFFYQKELGRAHQAALRGSLVISTDAGPIEYAERGHGTPVHGAGGGFDQGLALSTGFVGQDFRIIAPSRFGYLRTPAPHSSRTG